MNYNAREKHVSTSECFVLSSLPITYQLYMVLHIKKSRFHFRDDKCSTNNAATLSSIENFRIEKSSEKLMNSGNFRMVTYVFLQKVDMID